MYVKDQFKNWTVSKPSDGFITGRTALSPARRLKNRPRQLIALAWLQLLSRLQVDTCSKKASTYARSGHWQAGRMSSGTEGSATYARSDHWQAGRMSSGAEGSVHKHAHEGGARDQALAMLELWKAGRLGRVTTGCSSGAQGGKAQTCLHTREREGGGEADRSLLLREAKTHPSQSTVAEVASNMGWLKVWDAALDHGPSGTIAVLLVLKLLCKTVFADRKCNVAECDFIVPLNTAYREHYLTQHTDMSIDTDSLLRKYIHVLRNFSKLASNWVTISDCACVAIYVFSSVLFAVLFFVCVNPLWGSHWTFGEARDRALERERADVVRS